MHRHLFAFCLFAVTAATRADEFPPVSKLPQQAELPDPLRLFNGQQVTTPEEWRNQRRPELKALFEFYMYGKAPPAPDNVQANIERVDGKYFGGKATKKEVTLTFGPAETPALHLLL
ncbi:MAG TPA: acetylxylan esterase, partial [Pirellulales bacterium]|nr:acetylxylan esterase [Pirellulales bacterium]